jgi:ketosteroid isomerase-like protein
LTVISARSSSLRPYGLVLETTGRYVKLPGVTVADFRDGKIRSYRTYFDDASLIEQIAGV